MKIVKKTFLYGVLIQFCSICYADSVITFFVQKYPNIKIPMNKKQLDTYSKKLKQPGYLYKKIVKSKRVETGVRGLMGMYLGFVSLTNHDGQMSFPRKQQKPIMNILVTKKIQPVYMIAPETVHNWMLDKHEPAQMYECKLHHDDETKIYYIETKEINLPQDNMIPLNTIIIIANPKNVVIPEGATITDYSPNLILPTIYIKKHFDFSYNALYTLSIKQYFGQVQHEYKQEDQTVSKLLM